MHNAPGKKKRRSGKTTYFIIPTIRQSGKGKTYGDTAKMRGFKCSGRGKNK